MCIHSSSIVTMAEGAPDDIGSLIRALNLVKNDIWKATSHPSTATPPTVLTTLELQQADCVAAIIACSKKAGSRYRITQNGTAFLRDVPDDGEVDQLCESDHIITVVDAIESMPILFCNSGITPFWPRHEDLVAYLDRMRQAYLPPSQNKTNLFMLSTPAEMQRLHNYYVSVALNLAATCQKAVTLGYIEIV